MYFQYKQFVEFGIKTVVNLRKNENINDLCVNVIKQYVLNYKSDHSQFVRFLSFIVCFPVSEAIVESWGSSLENIYNKKHCVKDGSDLYDVGTVDRLTFIRLNGPPPSMTHNRCLYKDALTLMFGGDYACHFIHSGQQLNTTSKVVSRIQAPPESSILPCYL